MNLGAMKQQVRFKPCQAVHQLNQFNLGRLLQCMRGDVEGVSLPYKHVKGPRTISSLNALLVLCFFQTGTWLRLNATRIEHMGR